LCSWLIITIWAGAFRGRKISGKVSWRERKVAEVLESLRANDAIVVSVLSRLRRNMLECMEILSVAAQKRINVYLAKGAWRLDQSKIIAMAFSMAAEIERDLISQRTKEALCFKKAPGMKLGRSTGPGKSKLDPYRPEIESLLANGSTQKFVARRYTQGHPHTWLKKHGLKLSKDLTRIDISERNSCRRSDVTIPVPVAAGPGVRSGCCVACHFSFLARITSQPSTFNVRRCKLRSWSIVERRAQP
jgi:DNA invertase Pin-like site-specific DNA recombinase